MLGHRVTMRPGTRYTLVMKGWSREAGAPIKEMKHPSTVPVLDVCPLPDSVTFRAFWMEHAAQ
jgi:hypothetical protein